MGEDIVSRLQRRSYRLATRDFNGDGAKLAAEAADEIERLRAQLAACKEQEDAEWVKAIAERDHLRAELDAERQSKGTHHLWERIRTLNAAREAAEAERDELRAQLAAAREALEPFGKLFLYPDDLGFEFSEDVRADPDWCEDANGMTTEDVFVLRRDITHVRNTLARIDTLLNKGATDE